jgi:exonuclease VII small subunit
MKSLGNAEKKLLFKIGGHLIVISFLISLVIFLTAKKYDEFIYSGELDSIKHVYELKIDSINRINSKLDSVKAKESAKTDSVKLVAKYWKTKASDYKQSIKELQEIADSLEANSGLEECTEIVGAFRDVNTELRLENSALENANVSLEETAKGYSNQLDICETQRVNDASIIILKDSIIKNDSITLGVQKNINKKLDKEKEQYKSLAKYGTVGGFLAALVLCLSLR